MNVISPLDSMKFEAGAVDPVKPDIVIFDAHSPDLNRGILDDKVTVIVVGMQGFELSWTIRLVRKTEDLMARTLLSSRVNGANKASHAPSFVDEPLQTLPLSAHSSLCRYGTSKTPVDPCVAGEQLSSVKL